MSGGVFISYRRSDSDFPTGWIYDRLVAHFGADQVFKDVDSIEPGDDFVAVIRDAVATCHTLVAVIGPRWLSASGPSGRPRIDSEDDLVRLEIQTALDRGVRVIPVLIGGARMPTAAELGGRLAALANRNAIEVSAERFNSDVFRLVRALESAHDEAKLRPEDADDSTGRPGAPGSGRARQELTREMPPSPPRAGTPTESPGPRPAGIPSMPAVGGPRIRPTVATTAPVSVGGSRRTRVVLVAIAAVVVVMVTTIVVVLNRSAVSAGSSGPGQTQPILPPISMVVGSADFTENQVLAEIYAQALAAKGITVDRRLSIGSREVYYPGLQDGSIDLIPEYTGVLLQFINNAAPETSPDDVYAALQKALPSTLTVTDMSAAEDRDAIVVTRETAATYGARSIADLAPDCGKLTFGGPPEFQARPDGIPGIKKTYDCTFKAYTSLDSGGPLTIAALKNGDVQAADIFTTDPSIRADGFVVLDDPKSNFAAQNVVPLINKAKATDAVEQVLNAVSATLTTDEVRGLNSTSAGPTRPAPGVVAKDWLTKKGLI